jgi:hypothetical protein
LWQEYFFSDKFQEAQFGTKLYEQKSIRIEAADKYHNVSFRPGFSKRKKFFDKNEFHFNPRYVLESFLSHELWCSRLLEMEIVAR